jgi:hypothetical protein
MNPAQQPGTLPKEQSKSAGTRPHARLLSLRDLVAIYGLTIWFWRTAIWRGDIPHLQLGRKLVVDRRDVDNFIERRKIIEGLK